MIYSMTGYAKINFEWSDRKFEFEVKSLNSRQADIKLKLPKQYQSRELEFRKIIQEKLYRGKIDFQMTVDNLGQEGAVKLNKELITHYYHALKEIQDSLGEQEFNDYLPVIMRMPEVLNSATEEVSEQEWENIQLQLKTVLDYLNAYREKEGEILAIDIRNRIRKILDLLETIAIFEKERIYHLRSRITDALNQISQDTNFDKNRFEQELIYYLEKYDITEEKVRLKQHCSYFFETMDKIDQPGKKLGFIAQEILREINTIGSKSNHAEIQKIVVNMKDEIEKIKEQLFNIL